MRMLTRACGVVVVMLLAACGGSEPAPTPDAAGHVHKAPHGGTLVELGEHFAFLEVLVDPAAGTLTLYVLDGEAEKALRVPHSALGLTVTEPALGAELLVRAKANTLTGETIGDTSEFVVTADGLKGVTAVKARLASIAVKGQAFRDLDLSWTAAR